MLFLLSLPPLALALLTLLLPTPTTAFGTPNLASQFREHEFITRAALACHTRDHHPPDCFEPLSLDQLAGRDGTYGAVGSPDIPDPLPEGAEAHCDDADFLDVEGYPQSREGATAALGSCVLNLRKRQREGVRDAARLLDPWGRIVKSEVDVRNQDCNFIGDFCGRGKCNVLEGFGKVLHGVQDFYSHSNWGDHAGVGPFDIFNPPGLDMREMPGFLDLRKKGDLGEGDVPYHLSTGCFSIAIFPCNGRIDHAALNKDTGDIDPVTGAVGTPTTPRGLLNPDNPDSLNINVNDTNFARAVRLAIQDTARQWRHFRDELEKTYGADRARVMVCTLTTDEPWRECQHPVVDHPLGHQLTDTRNLKVAGAIAFSYLLGMEQDSEGGV